MQVLRLVCSCLQNAPVDDTWDLSSLLVNGSPVKQATVIAVLSVVYSSMGALDYEMERTAGQYSLTQLLGMLLFADAVGCSKAVQGQLAGLLGSCVEPKLQVPLAPQPQSDVTASAASSSSSSRGGRGRFWGSTLPVMHKVPSKATLMFVMHKVPSEALTCGWKPSGQVPHGQRWCHKLGLSNLGWSQQPLCRTASGPAVSLAAAVQLRLLPDHAR